MLEMVTFGKRCLVFPTVVIVCAGEVVAARLYSILRAQDAPAPITFVNTTM